MGWDEEFYGNARPYTADNQYVCPQCITDAYLISIVRDAVKEDEDCSFCDGNGAAAISVLLEQIALTIGCEYNDPAAELPYDSSEGGYQGEVLEGYEVVENLDEWTEDDHLREAVASAFGDSQWCKRDWSGLTAYEALRYGWEHFSELIKHRTRFLFLEEVEYDDPNPQSIPPSRMLEALGKLFHSYSLFRVLPLSTEFFRSRVIRSGDRPATADLLGTVPRDKATMPNRMSPAGIPMFYAALEEATAVLETFDPKLENGPREIVTARFRNTRQLCVLDLTHLPEIPSQFDPASRQERLPLLFLRTFVDDLTRAVVKDGRAHAEYAPTQVITEFVRYRLKRADGSALDGILYRSAQDRNGIAVVLFAENRDCGPRERHMFDPEPYLLLDGAPRYSLPNDWSALWQR